MKGLRVVLTTVLVMVMAAGMVLAQDRPDRPDRAGRGERGDRQGGRQGGRGQMQLLDRLAELDLTEEQRTEIEKLRADFEKQMKDAREKMRPKMEELRKHRQEHPDDQEGLRKKREEMQELFTPMREGMQGFIEEVKGVLNEEQLKKFDEMMAQRGGAGAMGGMGRGGRMGRGAMQALIDILGQLGLTNEQQQKIDVMRADFEKKIAEGAEGGGGQRGAGRMRRQMPANREQMQAFIEEVKTVLNEAQLTKFNELLKQRGGLDGLMGAGARGGAEGRPRLGIPGVGRRVAEQLELTEEQKEKLKGIVQTHMEEMQQMRDKLQEQIKEILTPEQAEKYEKAATEMRDRFQNRMRGGRRGEGGNQQRRRGGGGGEPPARPE